jgi:hypothetical protein
MTALAESPSIAGPDAEASAIMGLLRPVMRSRNQPAHRKPRSFCRQERQTPLRVNR